METEKKYDTSKLSFCLAVLSISLFLTSYSVINGIIPQMRDALGVTEAQAELLSTTPSLTALITLILSPWLARFFGFKKVIGAGLLLVGVTAFVPMFVNSYGAVMVARVLFGMGLGLYNSLAITQVQLLFSGDRRATMLGIRGATENLGQAIMTALVSVLFAWAGWHGAFGVYLFALPVLVWFWIKVPDIKIAADGSSNIDDELKDQHFPSKTNPIMFVFCAFAALYMIIFNSVNVRFAAIAQETQGKDYDSSVIISVGILFAVAAGFVYGFLEKHLGDKVFYVGLYFLGAAMVGFGWRSFPVLVIGFFLFNIPGPLLGPFLCNRIPKYATKKSQAFWSMAIIISFHVGIFLCPLVMQAIDAIEGGSNPAASFPIYTVVLALLLIGFFVYNLVHKKPAQVDSAQ